ncbi:MAG: hypothetical protein R2838_01765 [Caldilineaceae bacterium]
MGLLTSNWPDVFLMLPRTASSPAWSKLSPQPTLLHRSFHPSVGFDLTWWPLLLYLLPGGVMLGLLWPHLGGMRMPSRPVAVSPRHGRRATESAG